MATNTTPDLTGKKIGTMNHESNQLMATNKIFDTIGKGYAADLSGTAGSGDYITAEAFQPILFREFRPEVLYQYTSLFLNLFKPEQLKILGLTSTELADLRPGGKVNFY
jgi:hypothetical protein